MEGKKYEFTDGILFHRIRALKDFGDVKKGDFGGCIESEDNLSHEGNCWIYWGGIVMEHAAVLDDALIMDNGLLRHYAIASDKSLLCDNSQIWNYGSIHGTAKLCGNGWIMGHGIVENHSIVDGNAIVMDCARISNDSVIYGNPIVSGHTVIGGRTYIHENAKVSLMGSMHPIVNMIIRGNADIRKRSDILSIDGVGSRLDTLFAYCNADGGVTVITGCFSGNLDEFEHAVLERHAHNKYTKEYTDVILLIKHHFGIDVKEPLIQIPLKDLALISEV